MTVNKSKHGKNYSRSGLMLQNLSKISSLVKKTFCDNKKNITKSQNAHEKG